MFELQSAELVHQQFEHQVERTPDAVAIIDQGRLFTYRQLNASANQLAHCLQKQGVGPNKLVGVCLKRSPNLVMALLAVLKAGGAYIPMDPDYPPARLATMLEDAQVALLLTSRQSRSDWMTREALLIIDLDVEWDKIAQAPTNNLHSPVGLSHLAYVIYTSGSTGKPKGVMIEHRSLAAYAQTAATEYRIQPADRVLQFASISFDTSAEEIYPCLVRGATLVLRTDEMISSAQVFLARSQSWGITVWNLPTAFWHFLTTELARTGLTPPDSLRLVIIGGEKAISAQLALWRQQVADRVRLVNTYGPTETTIVATMCDLAGPHAVVLAETSPIGRRLPQVQLYILDEQLQPVPPGTTGELYIGGVGVARGYLNRPDLTAERFLPNPFVEVAHPAVANAASHLYKTGDRVRDRGDGLLEFLGRIDHQVKIRGFRVELFEIEAVLNQHPGVREGIVLAQDDALGNKRLVAYILPASDQTQIGIEWVQILRSHLQAKLPDYMVPTLFEILESLPLTPSGKVDRLALSTPRDLRGRQLATEETPQTPLEKQVSEIWSTVLKVPVIGTQDHFFELGGNSLLAAQLVSLLTETLQVELPIRCVYETPTVTGLVTTLQTLQQAGANALAVLTDLSCQPIPRPPKIKIHKPPIADLHMPETIFLTGGTGFLGAFLLYELLQKTQARIFCLVRCANPREGLARLRATFAKYALPVASLERRVIPVAGNLSQPRFGLSMVQFARLADQVDIIYHSGAVVNFVKPYSALEAANVQGTREILKLACQSKLKPVNYISTVGVFGAIAFFTGQSIVYENDDLDISRDFLRWDDGYAQTKWVAEQMILTARAKGVPVTVFRPGFIMGDSRTGAANLQDFLCRSVLGCIQIGCYPDLVNFKNQVVTVDYASQAIVHLSQQSSAIGQTFHLTPWSPADDIAWNDLFESICAYGYPLKKRTYGDWKDELIRQCKGSQTNALYPLLPFLSEKIYHQKLTILELYENTADFDCQNAIAGLKHSPITCPVVNGDLIYTYLSAFVNQEALTTSISLRLSA